MSKDRFFSGSHRDVRNFAIRRAQHLRDSLRGDQEIVGGFEAPEYQPQRDPRPDQLRECIDITFAEDVRGDGDIEHSDGAGDFQ